MTNRWIEYVKKFAKDNNLSYGCALTDPNLRKGYVPTGNKAKAKRQDEEREKRQDEEEARVNARNREEEKKSVANEPKNLAEAKKMLKKSLKNVDLSAFKGLIEPPANKKKTQAKKTPAKKTPTPAKTPTPSSLVNWEEEKKKDEIAWAPHLAVMREVIQLREQLAALDRKERNFWVDDDPDLREDIVNKIKLLERKFY
jgi:cell division septation protein DedD